jgi:hypothetical protein
MISSRPKWRFHTPRRCQTLNISCLLVFVLRHYLERPHHLVVFVFEDVAVPDVAAGLSVEGNSDAGDHGGVGADGVFPSHLFRGGRLGFGADSGTVESKVGCHYKGVYEDLFSRLCAGQVQ